MPLKRVEPGGQAKSLKDVWQNSLSGLINPTYGGNLPLAAWSTVGDLIDCGMQQVAHQISTVEGGSQTLAVVGYIPNKLIATVKDFSKDVAKKYLPKEYYQNLSEFYHGLPNNTKVTLNLFTDGLILHGAGSALKIALISQVPAAIQYIPHKPGISATPSAMLAFEEKMLAIEGGSSKPLLAIEGTTSGIGEISAISEVGKISVDTGAALGENILTKLEKPTTSSAVAKVEPVAKLGEFAETTPIIPEFTAKAKIVENPYLAKSYVQEIEKITKLQLPEQQVTLLKEALQTQEFSKLSIVEKDAHRARFNSIRPTLRAEWEQNTGQKWPVYEVDVYDKSGTKILRERGQPYDAHHIIQSNYGGPNTWWNIHPADNVIEHKLIHSKGSKANEIFKPK